MIPSGTRDCCHSVSLQQPKTTAFIKKNEIKFNFNFSFASFITVTALKDNFTR